MPLSPRREAELIEAVRANPLTCIRLPEAAYRRRDNAVVVYRDNVQEFLHRRLYRILIDPAIRRNYLIRTCETIGCINPYHYRLGRERAPLSRDVCPNGHEYSPENLTPTGHCRICVEAHIERRKAATAAGKVVKQPATHCPSGHEFTPENTYEYPGKYGMYRKCRTCTHLRNRARKRGNVRQNRRKETG